MGKHRKAHFDVLAYFDTSDPRTGANPRRFTVTARDAQEARRRASLTPGVVDVLDVAEQKALGRQTMAGVLNDIASHLQQHGTQTSPTQRGPLFGEDKVFIDHVWQEFHRRYPNVPRSSFDSYVAGEWQRGNLDVSRADLVQAMHPEDVAQSEVSHPSGSGEGHFIRPRKSWYQKVGTTETGGERYERASDENDASDETEVDEFVEALDKIADDWETYLDDPVIRGLVDAGVIKVDPLVLELLGDKEGEINKAPCKPGQTVARTGCTPKQRPTRQGRKPAKEKPTVEAVKGEIAELLEGKEKPSRKDVKDIGDKLSKLTMKQLGELKKEFGEKIYGNKAELVKRLAELAKDKLRKEKPAGGPKRIPATLDEVNKKIDRFKKLLQSRGQGEVAGWLDRLKAHVNEVGTESALQSLGADRGARTGEVGYEGELGWDDMPSFCRDYLDRNGMNIINPGGATVGTTISSVAPAFRDVTPEFANTMREELVGDFFPKDPKFKDKLEEAQHLPGLEASQDISELVGKKVTSLTDDVIAKLNEEYGEGAWIVKAYGDEAAAGYGIFFPQRAEQLKKDAQNAIWNAGEQVGKYGFELHRDADGVIDGIEHKDGKVYLAGTKEYMDTIHGDVRGATDALFADKRWDAGKNEMVDVTPIVRNESGASLPGGGKEFMAQPAFPVVGISDEERAQGVTIKKGKEGRVHITTKNGKAEIVPHSTWLKETDLPVIFENEDTMAMAKAAVDAINALPESERQGQIYAPDIVPTAEGYKVVEANPANRSGASGYLGDNPFIIDSYVSHIQGKTPAHVRFIQGLLSKRGGKRGENTAGEDRGGRGEGGESGHGRVREPKPETTGRTGQTERGRGGSPKAAAEKLKEAGVGSLPAGKGPNGRWDHPPEVRAKYNAKVLSAAKKSGMFIPPREFSYLADKPNIGGQEHDVHFDGDKFVKFTKGGHFGANKDLPEYLQRHEVADELWPSLGYDFKGITEDGSGNPQAVMAMNPIKGDVPDQKEVYNWFKKNGWEPADLDESGHESKPHPEDVESGDVWRWKDPVTGTVIGDTQDFNFLKTKDGIVPIDVDILPGKKYKPGSLSGRLAAHFTLKHGRYVEVV